MARIRKTPEEKKRTVRNSHLVRTYGITLDQYNHLLKLQDEKCAVCDKHYTSFNKSLCVDHDHVTGEVRGLLCVNCNQRVVGRHRDPMLFYRAWKYLETGTGFFVPPKPKKKKTVKRKKRSKALV